MVSDMLDDFDDARVTQNCLNRSMIRDVNVWHGDIVAINLIGQKGYGCFHYRIKTSDGLDKMPKSDGTSVIFQERVIPPMLPERCY